MSKGNISKKQEEILEYIRLLKRTDTYDVTQPNHVQSRFWMIHLISQDVRWFRFRS